MALEIVERLSTLPPYLFVEIDRMRQQAVAAGRDVISFGVGDPDRSTPRFIVDRLVESSRASGNHSYATGIGELGFRRAVAAYMAGRFRVTVDPECEVLALVGSKEGLAHLPMAVINPGDTVLIPEPSYPVYASGTVLAGGRCISIAMREQNGWLPVLDEIPSEVCQAAKLLFLNYPNNPTAACATLEFFEQVVAFARRHDILVVQDAAYVDVYFDSPPPSILQVAGAKDVAVEFHSLSKTFNMTGWRVAFAVGRADVLAALAKVKDIHHSGVFKPIQAAAVEALEGIRRPEVLAQREIYRRRRDVLLDGLGKGGWSRPALAATFYVWLKCPTGTDSMTTATRILEEAAVVVIPGIGFGKAGEGYVRFALTVDEDRTKEAAERIANIKW